MTESCDKMDLNRIPESNLSDAQFWNNEENFKAACNQFFILINGNDIVFDDNRSDFGGPSPLNSISDGSRVTPSTSSDWNRAYNMIFTANNIIEKAENVDFASINRWIAEAKFWRAYAYINLVKKYGDVPLVLRVLDIGAPEFTEARTDRETVIQQIYDDLDYSAANLPTFLKLGKGQYGRISKSAALALKSRIALYVGTHQKYHGWGQPSSNLSIAVSAAEAVMKEGHKLYTAKPYYYLFQNDGEGFANKENILSILYGADLSNSIRWHNIGRSLENSASSVTRSMVEKYLCTDGLPIDKSPLAVVPETEPMSIFINKDPRMSASIFKAGDPANNPDIYEWGKGGSPTRFPSRKYSIIADWASSRSFVDISIIRYAEVLLNYAEAKFELDGSISDDDLNKSINLLRDRLSMPHLTNTFVIGNGLDMRTEIRRERSVELAQEGFRYDDIIRWKIAEEVLPKSLIGATYFPDVYGNVNVSDDGYILVQDASSRNFDPAKDYLYPIPVREIALSEGAITQNPGW
ncbi:MAG: RagB/SusD family nutrient uptake outer membrane protein [Draconibacterium sp.]|nr:RagB/SusD family nutrient uptake outer membrane protein [Draconibacterium sp.]